MQQINPIFMFGFERSGTTLLSMIAGAHPDLAVPLTVTGLWFKYADEIERYGQIEGIRNLQELIADLLAEERIQIWDVELTTEEVMEGLRDSSYPAIIERFHQLYAQKKGKKYWGNLDIATLDHLSQANCWFPTARYIHIVRDGRDVALSHETMPYGASNTLECAQHWKHRLNANIKMGEILGSDRYLLVRYEDLVLDTETTLKKMCGFMGLEYSVDMLNYGAMVSEKVPENKRWLWPALDQKPQPSKCYGWKNRMDLKRRIVFEGEARDMLVRLGYEVYDQVPKKISAYIYELFCFLGRGGRFRRVAEKLGIKRKSLLERKWDRAKSA